MQKNQIIPHVFDVKPAAKTGDFDWKEKHVVGAAEMGKRFEKVHDSRNRAPHAYILGVPVESEKVPVFHDPDFDVKHHEDDFWEEQLLFRKESEEELSRVRAEQMALDEKLRKDAEQEYLQQQWQQESQAQLKFQAEQKLLQQKKIHLQQEQREIQEEIAKMQKAKEAEMRAMHVAREQAERERKEQEALAAKAELARRQQEEYDAKMLAEQEIITVQDQQRAAEDAEKQKFERFKRANQSIAAKKKKQTLGEKIAEISEGSSVGDFLLPRKFALQSDTRSLLGTFAIMVLVATLLVGGIAFSSKGIGLKGKVLGVSEDGVASLKAAAKDMAAQNFESSSVQFDRALASFSQGSQDFNEVGGVLLDATKYVPFASKISSGRNAVEAGKHFSQAGKALNAVVQAASAIKNPVDDSQTQISLLNVMETAEKNIAVAKNELDSAQHNIDEIAVDDLPQDKRAQFVMLKQKLPDIRMAMDLFLNNSHILVDLLGGNGPRKYLFLFQNNSEMRATGGFIGTYGLLDLADGRVKKFFIDGIFNPDGQLRDRIVPPLPIQKISTNWSLHDSNWFPDFPTSAKKAIYFYEKTGGPTADGVISFTPMVMKKLLQITGPIEMPEYNVTLDADNFIELTQFKVEVDYDKQDNRPKKILSDLAPLVLDKLLSSRDLDTISQSAAAMLDGLEEKHILFYSENPELEAIIKQQGWSGEMLPAAKDYFSVINTNINGFKTDAVVAESIEHKAEIQADGTIVDTLTITRKHNGGNTPYEWLNKVNADYMRVYVPQGSKLLEVSGQTREHDASPVDYDALGFKRDEDVQSQEQRIKVDQQSGTQIFDESDKTVFANWTYVSPGETMIITYKYLLPFELFKVQVGNEKPIDSYSLVAQKQSGSVGSTFVSQIMYPSSYVPVWNSDNGLQQKKSEISYEGDLVRDRFEGVVFEKN